RRRGHVRGRFPRGDELRRGLAPATGVPGPEQPVGDLGPAQEADPLAHHRPEGPRLRLPRPAGRRQRRAGGLRGQPRGGRAGTGRRRADPHRVRHLPPGRAHHLRRPDQVPLGRGGGGVGAQGSAHALRRLPPAAQPGRARPRRGDRRGHRARGGGLRGGRRARPARDVRPRLRDALRRARGPARGDGGSPGPDAGHRPRGAARRGRSPRCGRASEPADAGPEAAVAKLNMVKALNLALLQEMERDPDVLVIGEDVGVDGGVFRVTEDLHRKFGGTRVVDSPLAEAGIIGAAVGMSLYGLKPVCEIQFSGFAFQCFHQIENHVARYRMRTQGRFGCQMVVRMPFGGGVRALEHHSESEEQFYAHIPGLKMVIPSGPRNARALLAAAIRDPDPVIFFEAKALYHAAKEDVPDEIETMPIGRAHVDRPGRDLTLVAYGAMVRVAREVAERLHEEDGVEVEIVDLLTISPLDRETLAASVRKTGRAVIVHEAPRSFGPGAEIAASIMEVAFLSLEAPVRRVTANDLPFVGFARERANVPDVPRVLAACRETLAF